jgi:hypothetical protein
MAATASASQDVTLEIVEGADHVYHVFGAGQAFAEQAIGTTADWFAAKLYSGASRNAYATGEPVSPRNRSAMAASRSTDPAPPSTVRPSWARLASASSSSPRSCMV